MKLSVGSDYLTIKYTMVEIPILLKATFGKSNLRFFVNAGPTATYLLTTEQTRNYRMPSYPLGI